MLTAPTNLIPRCILECLREKLTFPEVFQTVEDNTLRRAKYTSSFLSSHHSSDGSILESSRRNINSLNLLEYIADSLRTTELNYHITIFPAYLGLINQTLTAIYAQTIKNITVFVISLVT